MKPLIDFGLVLGLLPGFAAGDTVEIHVAPTGDDSGHGSRRISGFRAWENGLWVADVPGGASGQWTFEQLWAGGHRARRAMDPDTGQFFCEEVVESDLGGKACRIKGISLQLLRRAGDDCGLRAVTSTELAMHQLSDALSTM